LYAHALNESLREGVNITAGKNVSRSMIGLEFLGVSGPVGIDEKGDRVASYRLQSFLKGMSSVRVANYFGTTGQLQLLNQTIIWPGGTTEIPLGRPACGFDNEFCKPVAEGMKQIKWIYFSFTIRGDYLYNYLLCMQFVLLISLFFRYST